ncbi:c-type cytochrome [Salmonirosea aquatica]|uniref:Cytochrome C n=1 Tax=Salmonirosea aquatica TaxID=2654236 RepID=A0A7C9FZK0_9BACT|nr:cytochrome C [Cytophagaceae bacterium SJW1-29]
MLLLILIGLVNCVRPKVSQPNGKRLETFQVQGTPALVAHGEYLANHVAACMDCHSQRDWTRLTGPIVPGTLGAGGQEYGKNYGLPGRVYGRNLTPAALKDWTDQELLTAITAGVTKSGKPLFPLMPYPNYHTMRQSDAAAIIAYLRTLPPLANDIPNNRIPAPVRLGMRLMPHRANLLSDSEASLGVPYGQYLTRMAGCADCHTNRTFGKLIKKSPFAGGMPVSMFGGTLRSANITPDSLTGIGRWTKADFVDRFKAYDPTHFAAPVVGDGFNTVMPWTLYAGMTEADLGAIYDYLRTVKSVRKRVVLFQPKEKSSHDSRASKSS